MGPFGLGQNDEYEMGNNTSCANQLTPIQIGTANHWVDVETSLVPLFCFKNDGNYLGWGLNLAGLLADNTVMARSVPTKLNADTDWAGIYVGAAHILALKTNGTLWSWGIWTNRRWFVSFIIVVSKDRLVPDTFKVFAG